MKTYETLCFQKSADWSKVPCGKIDCFNWESDTVCYRPNTVFQMCLVENEGFFVKMETDETALRCECRKRDDPCWEDSCMEFFIKPFADDERYMNFEMTPNGVYLCAVGKDRDNRKPLALLTEHAPEVKAQKHENGWSLALKVSCELIEAVYGKTFKAEAGTYNGNFYKCGDKTDHPHYGSFSKMGTLPPGFHNPDLFAEIIVKEDRS